MKEHIKHNEELRGFLYTVKTEQLLEQICQADLSSSPSVAKICQSRDLYQPDWSYIDPGVGTQLKWFLHSDRDKLLGKLSVKWH